MKQLTMAERNLARKLLEYEANQSSDIKDISGAEERATAKLRLHLARLIGMEGYLALLIRALALAAVEVSWLANLEVTPNGLLKEREKSAKAHNIDETEGYVTFMGHIIGLLFIFIGETLTLRLLYEVWPEITLKDTTIDSIEETE